MLAAVGGAIYATARAAGAEGPALTTHVPSGREDRRRVLRAEGHAAASGGGIRAAEYLAPRLTAVRGLVDAALVAVVPQMSDCACQDVVAVFGIDDDLRNMLGAAQADVGPVLPAVARLVDTVSNRDAVPYPSFAG